MLLQFMIACMPALCCRYLNKDYNGDKGLRIVHNGPASYTFDITDWQELSAEQGRKYTCCAQSQWHYGRRCVHTVWTYYITSCHDEAGKLNKD